MTFAFSPFKSFPIAMGVTTRALPFFLSGVSDLAAPGKAETLRRLLSPSRYWAYPEQIHGAVVRFLSDADLQRHPPFQKIGEADGLLTQTPQTTLSILTADCLPIFFLVPDPLTIGLVHAGWRGTQAAIARQAVQGLREATGRSPKSFRVAFGPCIRACCYDVGQELRPFFKESMKAREGRWYLDLVEGNRRQLEAAGMREENMSADPPCTVCHPDTFYSHRREKERAGRMVSWIRIRNVLK